MTSIFEVLMLQCPYVQARLALRRIVESSMRNGKDSVVLRSNLGPAVLRKRAVVYFGRSFEATHFDELWSIRWRAETGGPYPEFSGVVCVHHERDGVAQLEIRGDYTPPFGLLGKGFDLMLGQSIASQTCRHLLRDLATQIEGGCK